MLPAFQRTVLGQVSTALADHPSLVQVLIGPRQVGKTTLARQLMSQGATPSVYAEADAALPPGPEWVETHWRRAELEAATTGQPVLLVLDEIQKVRGWSETVKRLWDTQARGVQTIRLLVLGSSSLLIQAGLSESMAGRFFLHRCPHWTYAECRDAFGWTLDQWIYFGGYPGAVAFVDQVDTWKQYVADSLIETVLARDVLQLQRVAKPALLRHLFLLAAAHPAQILSYNKMLGQLHDAGNTTTLAHYVTLLESAFLVSGLPAYASGQVRQRASSPKLVVWSNALVNALDRRSPADAVSDSAWWGRLVENAVGAHLLNTLSPTAYAIHYWRQNGDEVDYVVTRGTGRWAIEVKSGRPRSHTGGLNTFRRRYADAHAMIVGAEGMPLEEFFSTPATVLFG